MDQVSIDHFTKLFMAIKISTIHAALIELHDRFSTEINFDLSKAYTAEEIKEALHQMAPLKAPHLDGMAPIFFQHFWPKMGNSVTQAILSLYPQVLFLLLLIIHMLY